MAAKCPHHFAPPAIISSRSSCLLITSSFPYRWIMTIVRRYSASDMPHSCAFFCTSSLISYETRALISSLYFSDDFIYYATSSCSASSGQIDCQSFGRISLRETKQPVSFSITDIHLTGIGLLLYLQKLNEEQGIPVLFENPINVSLVFRYVFKSMCKV